MEATFTFTQDYAVENMVFEGLTGREYVTSTKEALNMMKVKNPVVNFRDQAENGEFDDLTDEEYQQALDTIRCVGSLWRYPEAGKDDTTRYEMNVLTLLANAIELVTRQDVELRKYRKSQPAE